MIEIQGLRKSYAGREILKGIDLRIPRGRITGVVGPNACGKTTLMKCILGLVLPSAGTIRVDGRLIDPAGGFRRLIGYLPQTPSFPANLALQELIALLERLREREAPRKRELLERFRLQPFLKQPFGQLSGGTRQKVAAFASLLFDPPLLICDEPTAGLDPVSRVQFKDLLRSLNAEGKTIVLVSHFMNEVDQLASELVFLAEGRALYSGSLAELRARLGENDLERAIAELFAGESPRGTEPS
ncbi:MAG: ABC transporter ATP-binding protein [Oligoflexia bacterium]|nr:ABC transporter ATP-binding protein [Oligoflexia bacterium]